jgi:branched-chain amino acid transport system substrate-binding protein
MFGGTMIGLLITPIKTQLGPMLDGIVISESFVPAPSFNFPGVTDVLKRYQAKAAGEKIDPIGYAFVPFGYAAGQVYIHHHTFYTVVGEINYAPDGAWAAPRTLVTQFQNVAAGNTDQFRDGSVQPILWPPQYKPAP